MRAAACFTSIYTVGVRGRNVFIAPNSTSNGTTRLQASSRNSSAAASVPDRSRGGRIVRWASRWAVVGWSSRRKFSTNSPMGLRTYVTNAYRELDMTSEAKLYRELGAHAHTTFRQCHQSHTAPSSIIECSWGVAQPGSAPALGAE